MAKIPTNMPTEDTNKRPFTPRDTKHSMKRRAPWHDYRHPGVYMLTLVVDARRPLFGRLELGDSVAKNGEGAYVTLSPLGEAILNEELPKITKFHHNVLIWQACIMPDHLHLIVRVDDWLKKGLHLGDVVRGFKTGCNNAYWRHGGERGTGLFEPGYNDRLLFDGAQLDRWKHYLDDNPRRLALKRRHPDLFTVKQQMTIAGHTCQTVGNRFLLDIPDKVAVIVHRRYSEEEYQRLTEAWLACGERGGVLVSAAIAPKERAVLKEARSRGYRIIWLNENGFPEFYKPSGETFDACARGQILQVCPWEYHTEKRTISRSQCLELNSMAVAIAGDE